MGYVATIGVFDGLHAGHQALIQRTVEQAVSSHRRSLAVTFHPHPRSVLAPGSKVDYLMTLDDRLSGLRGRGISEVIAHRFDQAVARLTAREFLTNILPTHHIDALIVGENFRIGRDREAGVSELSALGREMGWTVATVPPVILDGARVSSSRIREALLADGDVALAARLLGRPYELGGVVVEGAGRGRTIGVPTANLRPEPEILIPLNGVYYCAAVLPEAPAEEIPGVLNIGIRPTFESGGRTVEVHLIEWSGDLYGREMHVRLLSRLREERKFASVQSLVDQIWRDIAMARTWVAG